MSLRYQILFRPNRCGISCDSHCMRLQPPINPATRGTTSDGEKGGSSSGAKDATSTALAPDPRRPECTVSFFSPVCSDARLISPARAP